MSDKDIAILEERRKWRREDRANLLDELSIVEGELAEIERQLTQHYNAEKDALARWNTNAASWQRAGIPR